MCASLAFHRLEIVTSKVLIKRYQLEGTFDFLFGIIPHFLSLQGISQIKLLQYSFLSPLETRK
jgi:hypothetical protein